MVNQIIEPMRAAFSEKKVSLDVRLADDLPAVLADPAAIGTALSNLLSNALKFTPAGGQVRVAAASQADSVAFTVSDTGPGIPAEFAARVFDKFFRVPRPEGPTGAGLGLTIAKEVIEAHGGHIELRGGSGSTFAFTLRQYHAPAALVS
jgi:signal transduction histidine kinase